MDREIQVLLIEDNDVDAAVFTRSVEAMPGWRVTRVRSLEDAEEVVEERGNAFFDLVAVDLTLPDAVDLEAVQFARTQLPNAVCVAVTARDPDEVDERALRAGAADLLVKGQMNARGVQRAVSHAVERNSLVRRQLESERNLRSVLSAWTDALLVVDEHRRVLFRNDAAAALAEAALEPDAEGARLRLTIRPGEVLELELPLPGGEPLPVQARSWAITWADRPAQVVVLQDRRAERAAAQARAAAEAGRGALKGVHDIGNRVQAMQGVLEEALASVPEGAPLRDALERLRHHLDHVAEVVRLSREDAARLRRRRLMVDLASLARSSCQALRPAIEKAGALRQQFETGAFVHGEPVELTRVLDNLLKNAVEAVSDLPHRRGEIRVAVRQEGPRVILEVEDDGPGIPPALLGTLFDEGVTGKANGTGLGLSSVRRIVQEHGGEITVTSESGRGACFRVELPAVRPARELRLLLLEDQPEVARANERLLGARYAVEVAHDGGAALARLREPGAAFDVVLCDLDMPGMDGRAFFERLRAEHPAVAGRVVFCSGGATTPEVEAFLRACGRPLLQKPIDLGEAIALIDRAAEETA